MSAIEKRIQEPVVDRSRICNTRKGNALTTRAQCNPLQLDQSGYRPIGVAGNMDCTTFQSSINLMIEIAQVSDLPQLSQNLASGSFSFSQCWQTRVVISR